MTGQPAGEGVPGARFTVRERAADGAVVLALAGELDHDTADPLREALADGLGVGADRILVDCAELRFCDSTGLNVLLRGRLAAQDSGIRLELAALQPPVARMFHITGADGVFRVHADLAEALADRRQT
ncbi:STAS domain-containing protein [Streptomyces sp. A3M-1-3]|uniref:STAS domain-containing protein n=1 Tax=Streptomyces sp. A3M-1-3 TaxID=2962044 RepID=UPI0020B857DF|nr:STAS domain-containing protein [Streptomyces sp. A3M-1-3]MCP3820670.1 STAS domain-containing protein [Streptomyces sp. A3M-1-3]